jgi:C2H2-type zinc finger
VSATKAGRAKRPTRGSRSNRFVCPECGRKFERPQALGAHRRQAHGVAGESARSQSRVRSAQTGKRQSSGGAGLDGARAAANVTRGVPTTRGIDRDALLRALFPDGIPPREETIRSVNAWLDEAERLTQRR